MTTVNWNTDSDGDWSVAGNWSPSGPPGASDDVNIDTADLHTITYSTGTSSVNSLTVGNDDFDVTGGALTVTNDATFANSLNISGGTLNVGSDYSGVVGACTISGNGVLAVTNGDFALNGGGSSAVSGISVADGATLIFYGDPTNPPTFHLTGGGTLGVSGSTVEIDDGVLDVAADTTFGSAIDIEGGVLKIDSSSTVNGTFDASLGGEIENSGTLNLDGGGALGWSFIDGSGETILNGTTTATDTVYVYDGQALENTGTLTFNTRYEPSIIDLGYGEVVGNYTSGSIVNDASGTIDAITTFEIFDARETTTFTNAGSLVDEAVGTSYIGAGISFVNKGSVDVQDGELDITGRMTGSGTVTVESGASVVLDASASNAHNRAIISGDGTATLTGGSANDTFRGGRGNDLLSGGSGDDVIHGAVGNDQIDGGAGADRLAGGAGSDHFVYDSAADSTGPNYDTIKGFDALSDKFCLPTSVISVDAALTQGALSTDSFNADLHADLTRHILKAHTAIEFTPDSGTLVGDRFLVVDLNGVAGYQAGHDLVILLSSPQHMMQLSTADFV